MSKGRKIRNILLGLALGAIIVVAGGWFWAKAEINNLVSKADHTKMPSTETSVEEWFNSPAVGSTAKSGVNNSESTGVKHSPTGGTMFPNEQQKADPKAQKMQQIKEKYKAKLVNLQGEYESRLNSLLAAAKADYSALKKAGGSQVETVSLFQKYMRAGRSLEADCDNKFNTTVNNMEAELKANGLPTDLAARVKAGYAGAKEQRRSYLLGKALKHM